MYKVIFVDALSFSGLEEELNALAEEGYRMMYPIQLGNRAVVVMERKGQRGRPPKQPTDEAELGD